ncbi:MAG TPA: acyl carrier protein, partial [Thermoanaerobaculia bacterium]|nr:acyl carrier protein [Thermoanaerobaculia bacterium]
LFLRQATALQLQKPIEDIPTDRSYFDLGLPSLAIAHLIGNMNQLLDEELQPSALFEYTDIRSLAAYLAETYPAKIHSLSVTRRAADLPPAKLTPLPPVPVDRERVLTQVLWQEASPDDGYEKLTF